MRFLTHFLFLFMFLVLFGVRFGVTFSYNFRISFGMDFRVNPDRNFIDFKGPETRFSIVKQIVWSIFAFYVKVWKNRDFGIRFAIILRAFSHTFLLLFRGRFFEPCLDVIFLNSVQKWSPNGSPFAHFPSWLFALFQWDLQFSELWSKMVAKWVALWGFGIRFGIILGAFGP